MARGGPKIGDVFDEEFANYLQLAKALIDDLAPKDKKICRKWIMKLCDIKATDPVVKKNRNYFFQYFLQIIQKTVQTVRGGAENAAFPQYNNAQTGQSGNFMSRWSEDKRTYVAAQPLPGKGTLIYMAVAKEPNLGWDMPNRS